MIYVIPIPSAANKWCKIFLHNVNLFSQRLLKIEMPFKIVNSYRKQEAKGLKADRKSNLTAMPVITM